MSVIVRSNKKSPHDVLREVVWYGIVKIVQEAEQSPNALQIGNNKKDKKTGTNERVKGSIVAQHDSTS